MWSHLHRSEAKREFVTSVRVSCLWKRNSEGIKSYSSQSKYTKKWQYLDIHVWKVNHTVARQMSWLRLADMLPWAYIETSSLTGGGWRGGGGRTWICGVHETLHTIHTAITPPTQPKQSLTFPSICCPPLPPLSAMCVHQCDVCVQPCFVRLYTTRFTFVHLSAVVMYKCRHIYICSMMSCYDVMLWCHVVVM